VIVKIDLHGIKHEAVRRTVIKEIEAHWQDEPQSDFVIVTGHSCQMREIIAEIAEEYKLNMESGLYGAYVRLIF
jgi:hypothetical protein